MIRLESLRSRKVIQEVVRNTKVSAGDFENFMQAATQPDAQALRDRLKSEFLPNDARDNGKKVLFEDLGFFGVSPQSFGREDDVVVASDIGRALKNLQWIKSHSDPNSRYVGLFGYPTTAEEFEAVFGKATTTFGTLDQWKQHRIDAEAIAADFGIELIDRPKGEQPTTKAQILAKLEKADGVVLIVAHANHCTVHLPGGGDITITPEDISNLHLARNPFVVLRVCQASDHGFASAFVHAGARGVWINRGIIGASAANQHVAEFMKRVRSGMSIGTAISELRHADPATKSGTHLVVEIKENHGFAERSHQRAVGSVER